MLCAKTEELREVRQVFNQRFSLAPLIANGNALADQIYAVDPAEPKQNQILMATCGDMGHVLAAIATSRIVTSYHPGLILFVGTAASLMPDKVQIGDVVIPKAAHNRIYDKVTEKGQADYEDRVGDQFKEHFFGDNALLADVVGAEPSVAAKGRLSLLSLNEAAGRLHAGDKVSIRVGDQDIALRSPTVLDDVDILSCGMVVDSLSYRDFLASFCRSTLRKTSVIDMESFGFFKALEDMAPRSSGSASAGLMIRGISDYAGKKQQTEGLPSGWKENALRNAASVAADLILANCGR